MAEGHTPFDIEISTPCSDPLVQELFQPLLPWSEVVSVYLHGSRADQTTTVFSDFDDFIVIDDEQAGPSDLKQIYRLLDEIDYRFCREDPLQHHGHFVATKRDLSSYDASRLPLFILKDAVHLMGARKVEAMIDPDTSLEGLRRNIGHACTAISHYSERLYDQTINAYELKGLIGLFVLMPAYLFQRQGVDLTKPEAIARAGELFPEGSLQLIQWATTCRENWTVVTETRSFRNFTRMFWLIRSARNWRRFARRFSPVVTTEQYQRLSRDMPDRKRIGEFLKVSMDRV